MDLDELRTVQSKERRKDSLQHLRDSFYEDVGAYLRERKRERDERAAAVDSPFSDERVRKLSDEIETAEEVVESLYERRVGKVVKLASFAAAGAPTDTDGMTVREAELFEDLVARIETNKGRVLSVLEEGADVEVDAAADARSEPAVAAAPGGGPGGMETDDPSVSAEATSEPTPEAATSTAGSDGDAGGGLLADAMGGQDASTSDSGETGGAQPGSEPDRAEVDPDVDPETEAEADGGTVTPAATEPTEGFEPGDGEPVPKGRADQPESADGHELERANATAETQPDASATASATVSAGEAASTASDERDAPATERDPDADAERRTVRITQDVGTILGTDEREYDLAAEDVVSLPAANVDPLVQRDAAEPLE